VEGDGERMDITPWITIEPEEYTIRQGENIVFTVRVKIPADATPGVWGATSKEAGQSGHSAERRTYLIFKDTVSGGNVYTGLLIPISVVVLGEASPAASVEQPSPQSPALNFIKDNIIAVVLGVIIVILLAVLLGRIRAKKTG
jgi:fumarate reductase subunit D